MLCSKKWAQEALGQKCISVAESATIICLGHALSKSLWGSCSMFSTCFKIGCATYGIPFTLYNK